MEKKYGKDKFLLVLGGFLITITLAVPIGYQLWIGIYEGNPYKETEEMKTVHYASALGCELGFAFTFKMSSLKVI